MRTPSAADQQAIDAAGKAGIAAVTARSLERWRQAGLIPAAERRGLGHARGSQSDYTPAQLTHIVAAARAAHLCRRLDDALVWVFCSGYPIEEEHARATYRRQVRHVLGPAQRYGPDPLDQAEGLAGQIATEQTPGARQRRKRARQVSKKSRHTHATQATDEDSGEAANPLFDLFYLGIDGDRPTSTEGVIELVSDLVPTELSEHFDADTPADLEALMGDGFSMNGLADYTDTVDLDRLRQVAAFLGLPGVPVDPIENDLTAPDPQDFVFILAFTRALDGLQPDQIRAILGPPAD